MNLEPLDELYFQWLYTQVASSRLKNPARTHWSLTKQLHTTEFFGNLPNDENRVYEGKELRLEFLEMNPAVVPDTIWLEEGVSFLEMLIALSRRLSFADERASSAEWFWRLLNNVDLKDITDSEYASRPPAVIHGYINEVLQTLNDRKYDYNGRGGLFPLRETDVDQRHVELWYQMQYYLIERS
jgi:hypothetical protein